MPLNKETKPINIHGTHVTANNSTNKNIEFFFCFRFENSMLLIFDRHVLGRGEKIICVTTYLEIKIIQNCLKIDATHLYGNNLLLRQETKKKRLNVLEADIITIKKTLI